MSSRSHWVFCHPRFFGGLLPDLGHCSLLAVKRCLMVHLVLCSQIHTIGFITDFGITCVVTVMFTLLTLAANSVCGRYMLRMYADGDAHRFAAVVQNTLCINRTIHFSVNDTNTKPPYRHLGYMLGNLLIRGQPFNIDYRDFVQLKYFNVLMGYEITQMTNKNDDMGIYEIFDNMSESLRKQQTACENGSSDDSRKS